MWITIIVRWIVRDHNFGKASEIGIPEKDGENRHLLLEIILCYDKGVQSRQWNEIVWPPKKRFIVKKGYISGKENSNHLTIFFFILDIEYILWTLKGKYLHSLLYELSLIIYSFRSFIAFVVAWMVVSFTKL